MKKVEAYIKKHRLNEVIEALHMIDGLTGVSVLDVRGFGRTRNKEGPIHIVDNIATAVPHVKLEIVCMDNLLDTIVDTIQKAAHTGLRADGKIYISDIEDAIRISTGERGEGAV